MKRILKRARFLMLTFVCALSAFSLLFDFIKPVYASELNSNCNVKFMIVDSSDGYDGSSFTVQMDDIMGEATEKYELKKAASWGNTTGNIPTITIPAPTTYNITINGLNEGYKLVDFMSGEDIETSFAATSNGEITFYWAITKDDGTATGATEESVTTANATSNVAAEDTDAEKIYSDFLKTVSFIQEDDSWSNFLEGYSYPSNISTFGKMYAACVNNENKTSDEMMEEYEALSDYDKFLWYATYLEMAYEVNQGHSDQVANYDSIVSNYSSVFNAMQGKHRTNEDKVVAAYEKLLKWQADYIAANGSPFNFINNRSYLEETGVRDVDKTDKEVKKQEQKEIEEARKEINKIENEEKTEKTDKEKGIWTDTLNIISSNLITILLLAILICGLGYVIYIKKKNNYTDEIHEK